MKRVLLTGMSGTGKSTVTIQLQKLGFKAVDLDSEYYSHWVDVAGLDSLTPEPGKDWVWREDRVQELLSTENTRLLFVSGCAENMRQFFPQFDYIILLTAPEDVMVYRLRTRINNLFGKRPEQLAQVLALKRNIEPLLRKKAGYVVDTNIGLDEVLNTVLNIAEAEHPGR